jgi:hypothetical protein
MKRYYIVALLFCVSAMSAVFAQTGNVGIGTNNPNASAILDVSDGNRGLLIPRVALTATNTAGPITSPATSLMVYNTATNGTAPNNVTPGYYYNAGTPALPNWVKIFTSTANTTDLGYILGWSSNIAPPDYLLPLNGGTYNWADYPDFQTFHATYPCQFIASSTGTTFTLVNINTSGRFLRGGTSAGVLQNATTAAPTSGLTIANAGAHTHSIDPPSTATSSNGDHNHTLTFNNDDFNGGGGGNNGLEDDGGPATNVKTTSTTGAHTHTLDIPAFNSSSNGDHTHSVSGWDTETRPINTSVIWCIKVKPTATTGNVSVVNTASTAINGLSVYGSAIGLGGNLNQNTTINQAANSLIFNLNGTGDFEVQDNGVSALVVNDAGNVGINNPNPTAKLHVLVPNDANNNPENNGIYVYNAGNAGDNDDAIIAARVAGANAGDPFLSLDINGVTGWSVGIDNSDADKLKFSNSWSDPGANTRMSITTAGEVNIPNLSGTGDRPVYADATGTLKNLPTNYRIGYLEDRSEKTLDASNVGFRNIGGTTSNLYTFSGDVVVVNVTLKFAFTNGSNNDDVRFRLNIGGCVSTSQTESFEFENFDGDRNEYQPISMQFVWVASCEGNVNFQLAVDSNSDADDNTKYGDLVIVATKY